MNCSLETIVRTNVLQLLNQQGLSIRQMALDLNCDPTHLSRVINGKRTLFLHHVLLFAEYFHVSPEQLLQSPKKEYRITDEQDIQITLRIPHYDTYKRICQLLHDISLL